MIDASRRQSDCWLCSGEVKYYDELRARRIPTMRDRFEETMLTIVRCASALAMAVGLIFALETVPAARAQVTIDVSKITCNQLIDREVGEPRDIAIWLSGYYHGKRGETTVDKLKLLNKYVKEVRDYCFRNPQTSVMQAVETLIERTR